MPDVKVKMLIVDDDPLMRLSLSQVFTEFGYHVRSAEDGFSALTYDTGRHSRHHSLRHQHAEYVRLLIDVSGSSSKD